jgi:hypothetical protein
MSRDLVDREGKPLGADFITFYAASELALQGRLAEAYDPSHMLAAERAAVPANIETFPWLYPPSFALAVLPLALMPYVLALVVFLGVTLALYLWLVYRVLPDRRAVVAALAFSGAFVNAMSGQNGFLTTALLGGGLLLLESRPVLAGALIGLLTVKPHLGLLLPFALAPGGSSSPISPRAAATWNRARSPGTRWSASSRPHGSSAQASVSPTHSTAWSQPSWRRSPCGSGGWAPSLACWRRSPSPRHRSCRPISTTTISC